MNGWLRPELQALDAYALDLSPVPHKLDQNEVPWEVPRPIKLRWMNRMLSEPWNRYPDFHGASLCQRLSEFHRWPKEGVLVGNGSNELLQASLFAVAGGGRRVLSFAPSFTLYRAMVTIAGGKYEAVGPRRDLRLDFEEFEERLVSNPPDILLINSPNNPTGEAIAVSRLEKWIGGFSGVVLLDQAYVEFSDQDARPLLEKYPNVLLFRTFSKALGLAGLRLGYLLGAPDLIRELRKVKLPYNLGRAAAIAGELLLEPEGQRWVRRVVQVLRGRRSKWAELLAAAGAEVWPSETNFLLTRWTPPAFKKVLKHLTLEGIRVRNVSRGNGLTGCLRISIGNQKAFRALNRALQQMAEAS